MVSLAGPMLPRHPVRLARVGLAFALIAATSYVVSAPTPGHALEPQTHHDLMAVGTEVFVLVGSLLIAGRLVRVLFEKGK
jgi:hypothetical protein